MFQEGIHAERAVAGAGLKGRGRRREAVEHSGSRIAKVAESHAFARPAQKNHLAPLGDQLPSVTFKQRQHIPAFIEVITGATASRVLLA